MRETAELKTARGIKMLRTQLANLSDEIVSMKSVISTMQQELNVKQRAFNEINAKVKSIESNKVVQVTEHALLRYLERVNGVDLSEIQDKIINERLMQFIETLGGNGTFPCDGFSVVIKDYKIITITT